MYRKYENANILGLLVVAKSYLATATAELISGGVSYDYLKIALKCYPGEKCYFWVFVSTDKETPHIIREEI